MEHNYKLVEKEINKDLCNSIYSRYLKELWGITVGYNSVKVFTTLLRKRLLDYQLKYDCDNSYCLLSKNQPVIKLSEGTTGHTAINTPLSTHECHSRKRHHLNFNQIIIRSFYR